MLYRKPSTLTTSQYRQTGIGGQWRLIYDSPTTGVRNMAVDEAILSAVSAGSQPPTLRLYGWQPACLSLGYGQRLSDVDFDRLRAFGWDVVRRPTGGRAILHADELTYSVTLPAGHPLADGGVVDSYRRLSAALMAALVLLGARGAPARRDGPSGASGPVCFETPAHYEITVNGRKLVGSAQIRRRGGILQHGSLPLMGDVARICDALAYPDDERREQARSRVRRRAITVADAVGADVSWRTAADALVAGFQSAFGIVFGAPEKLSRREINDVSRLLESSANLNLNNR